MKLISFDLQGTLSDNTFSDEFWLELLPAMYAKKHNIGFIQAKKILELDFKSKGKYHELFYNHRLRLDELLPHWEFHDVVKMLKSKPQIDLDMLKMISKIPLNVTKIVFSATTRDFIDIEMADAKQYFDKTFSSIDDFGTAGKPSVLFQKIASIMQVNASNCLHIGDCHEMDYDNAKQAGWHSYHFNKNHSINKCLLGLEHAIKKFLT